MADDLDKSVLEAADSYTKTAPPPQTVNLPKLPPPIQKPTVDPQEGAFTRFMHGAGLPASKEDIMAIGEQLDPMKHPIASFPMVAQAKMLGSIPYTIASEIGEQGGKALDALQHKEYGAYLKHSLGAAVPMLGPPLAEGNYAGAMGRAVPLALATGPKLIRSVIPEQAKFDLINKAVGEESIEPKYGKDLGRGLARSKQGPLTRGQASQPSAGVYKETGLPKAVKAGLEEASNVKNSILQHPAAQAKTIDGIKFIEDNFGPVGTNPITGAPEVQTIAPTNVPDGTVTQFNAFGNKLLAEIAKRGGKLSAADIEQMRDQGIIDPNYGSFSTEAPDLALNQKAGRVSSALIKAAENATRLPNGQSALELVNSHMADLMQGKKILPEKLATSRTSSSPSILNKVNPKAIVKNAVKEAIGDKPAPGFQSGKIGMPVRTGLASALTEKPWWLKDPTRGLSTPNAAPPELELPPTPPGANTETSSVQSNFPQPPTHIEEGQTVTGMDTTGETLVSGEVKKIYAVADPETGIPQWKALVLDNQKSKVVEVSADQTVPVTHPDNIDSLVKKAGEAQYNARPRTGTRAQEIVDSLRKDMESRKPMASPSTMRPEIREIQDRGFKNYNPGGPDPNAPPPESEAATIAKSVTPSSSSTEAVYKKGDLVRFSRGGETIKGKVASEVQQSKKGPYVVVERSAPYTGQYNVLLDDLTGSSNKKKSGDSYRRTNSPVTEWPEGHNDKNENEDLLRTHAPSILLDSRFKHARQMLYGSPLSGKIDRNPHALGMYGAKFVSGPESGKIATDSENAVIPEQQQNTALISKEAGDQPQTFAHELGHSMWKNDLTPAEQTEWNFIFDRIIHDREEELGKARDANPEVGSKQWSEIYKRISSSYPKAIMWYDLYGEKEMKREEAFAELQGQYMANPSAFKAKYPDVYNYFKVLNRKEFIKGK